VDGNRVHVEQLIGRLAVGKTAFAMVAINMSFCAVRVRTTANWSGKVFS
jgi:hypothetical protein